MVGPELASADGHGVADVDSVLEAVGHGANGYLTKPVDLDLVVVRIGEQLACGRADEAQHVNEERRD